MIAIRVLGFGLWISWLWMLFLEGPLLVPTAERWHLEASSIFMLYMFCSAGSLLFLAIKLRPRTFLSGGMLPASIVLMFLGPLLLAFVPSFFPSPLGWLVPPATFLSALGSSVLGSSWLESFSKMRLSETAAVFAGAVVVAGLSTIAAAHAAYFVGMGAVSLMPAVSYILLQKQHLPADNIDDHDPSTAAVIDHFPAKLIILFALFYAAGGLMFKIVSLEQTYPYLFYLANGSYALVCLFAGLLLYYKPTIDLRLLYRPVLPFLGIGFILFVAKIQYALLPFLLLQAGFALFDMYTWLLIAYLARFNARPAAVCCFGQFLITFSLFGGNVIFLLWTELAGESSIGSLAMIAGVLCLLAVLVFSDNRETFSGWDTPFVGVKTDEPAGVAATASPPGLNTVTAYENGDITDRLIAPELTLREKEVLLLLIKGRNNRFIGEALNISGNTVKYHIRNLYDKFQVNNRQELLDIFDQRAGNEQRIDG